MAGDEGASERRPIVAGLYLISVIPQREVGAAVSEVHGAVALLPRGRWLLAVSGGRDSMVLLDAMGSARSGEVAAVATFDHGTGAAARRACALVEREAEARALPVVSGRAPAGTAPREADWRAARLGFLEEWARELDAAVVTGHTRDDQIETVVQRLLRDAGPRGLAGMHSRGARPLLPVSRETVASYARARRVAFVEDPSNRNLTHQRNRVRLELLPALERVQPGFGDWCWDLSLRAAAWRSEAERVVDALGATLASTDTLVVPVVALGALGAAEWRVLWPALAARVGVVMDRRGIERAAAWAPTARRGGSIQLSGGGRIACTGPTFVLRGNDAAP